MSTKRLTRSSSVSDLPIKKKKLQLGLFLYNIPPGLSVLELQSKFQKFEVFIPTFKENHVRIGYIVFDSSLEKSKIIGNLNRLGIDTCEFNPNQNCSLDQTISEIQLINSELNKLSKNEAETRRSLKRYSEAQIEYSLRSLKHRSIILLSQNYNEILDSYRFLERNKTSKVTKHQEINCCIWLIIYCFCYFISYKVSKNVLIKYTRLFKSLKAPDLFSYIKKLRSCKYIQRYLVIDFLWQLTFMENQFNYEDQVIKCLIDAPREEPDQLKIILPELYKLLSAILKTDIVNDQLSLGIDYGSGVNEYVSKIYLTILPDSIQGLTLFNRCVAIKKKCNALEFEQEPVLRGFTLMTALHEYGHFAQRFYLYL